MREIMNRLSQHGRSQGDPSPARKVPLLRLMLVMLVSLGMGFGGFVAGYQAMGSQRHDDLEDLENYQTLVDVYDFIREYYVASDDVTDDQLVWGAARGMVEALGDEGHSVFLDPDETREREEARASGFVGIGVFIDTEVIPPRVVEPMPNSPALAAGILPGDEILAVDGVPFDLLPTVEDFLNLISGEEGTDVVIELRHIGEADSYEVTMTRASIARQTVTWALLPEHVMWLRINAFNEGTGQEVIDALQEGKDLGAEALILDLRDNGGGLIKEELIVQGQFLEAGLTAYIGVESNGDHVEHPIEVEQGEWREQPMVVLINDRSASAAEATAASLAAHDRAITIGETTYGTGTSLATFDFDDGSSMMLGVELWLTPDEESIWMVGLDPMIEVRNEPGAQLLYPQMYPDGVISDDEFAQSEDIQLRTGFEEVLRLVADQ